MEAIKQDQMVQIIATAAGEVFSTMLGMDVRIGESRLGSEDSSSFDGVVALVGIGGNWTGTGRIYCSPAFAAQIAGALLSSEYDSVDEDVLDAVAEVANMIIGNIKTAFEKELGPLGLSVPTVIFGRNYRARSIGACESVILPLHWQDHTMEIRFCLMPSAQRSAHPQAQLHPRTETVPA